MQGAAMQRWTVLVAFAMTFPHAGFSQGASGGATAFVDVNVVSMASERILPRQTVVARAHRAGVRSPALMLSAA
jgi:hypothetical protein